MKPVHDISEVYELLQSVKSKCGTLLTNLFIDPEKTANWISDHKLSYVQDADNGVLLLRRNNDFDYIYYFTENADSLQRLIAAQLGTKGTYVTDLVGRSADVAAPAGVFAAAGFNQYSVLQRYSRINKPDSDYYATSAEVDVARPADAPAIATMLKDNFDPYADQINSETEIADLIAAERIIKIGDEQEVKGFLIRTILPQMSVLNNFLVNPLSRGEKIGSKLLKHYIFETKNSRRLWLWVKTDNEHAVELYKRHGYHADDLLDLIMIKKQDNG